MTRHFLTGLGACRLLVWSFANTGLVACSAFDGGQSGTDSLEAIGVNQPAMKCEGDEQEYEAGDKVLRKDGCEECVCKDNGNWKCVPVDDCTEPDGASGNESGEAESNASTETETINTGIATSGQSSGDTAPIDEEPPPECLPEILEPSIGGSNGVYVATDPDARVCVTQKSATELCMIGDVVDAGENYENWGGGMGLFMASEGDAGVAPFDADGLGIQSVRFTLTGINGFVIRAYLNQVNDPTISDPARNYQDNSFVLLETSSGGSFTLPLASALLPEWTQLDTDNDGASNPETTIDTSVLNSLQFFVAAEQGPGTGVGFEVCLRDLEWLDANGETVIPSD